MLATRTRHAKNLWLVGIQQVQHSQPRDRQLRIDFMTLPQRSGGSLYSLTQCWSGDTTPKRPAPALWLKTRLQAYCKSSQNYKVAKTTNTWLLWSRGSEVLKAKSSLQAVPLSKRDNICRSYFLLLIRIWSRSRTRQVSTHKGALPWWPWKQSRSWSMLTSWHGQSCCVCQPCSLQLKPLTTQGAPWLILILLLSFLWLVQNLIILYTQPGQRKTHIESSFGNLAPP